MNTKIVYAFDEAKNVKNPASILAFDSIQDATMANLEAGTIIRIKGTGPTIATCEFYEVKIENV